jgi:hypothetical protein
MTKLLEKVISEVKKLPEPEQDRIAEDIFEMLRDIKDEQELDELERRIDAGLEPLYDHEEVWKEIEALETKGELPN